MDELVPIIIEAPADRKTRDGWLESLWEAYEEDGVDYTYEVADRWGELCGSPEAAAEWADRLLPPLKITWGPEREKGSYYRGTPACLSSMLAAGRYHELLDLLDKAPYVIWFNRKFGVKALVALSSLKWMAQGEWYKLGHRDVVNAYRSAIKAAEALCNVDETKERIRVIAAETHEDCQWIKQALEAALKMEQIPDYFDTDDG